MASNDCLVARDGCSVPAAEAGGPAGDEDEAESWESGGVAISTMSFLMSCKCTRSGWMQDARTVREGRRQLKGSEHSVPWLRRRMPQRRALLLVVATVEHTVSSSPLLSASLLTIKAALHQQCQG